MICSQVTFPISSHMMPLTRLGTADRGPNHCYCLVFVQASQSRTFFFTYPILYIHSIQSSLVLPISVQIHFIYSFNKTGCMLPHGSNQNQSPILCRSLQMKSADVHFNEVFSLLNSLMILCVTTPYPLLMEKTKL